MPTVTVKFFATVREATGVKSIELDVSNVGELLDVLKKKFGKPFHDAVIDSETGLLKRFFSFMVNGKRTELLDGYDTILNEGDSVALFPPIGGG